MEIRHLTKEELKLAYEMRSYSFYDWTDTPPDEKKVDYLTVGEILGVFNDGELVSILRNLSLRQSIRGIVKKMGGIASVSTPPEHRRKGLVRVLMQETFNDMRNKGQVVSMLWPFKESFYDSFGYVSVCSCLIVNLPLPSLSHYLLKNINEIGWKEKRYRAKDVKDTVNEFKHILIKRYKEDYNGLVLLDDIEDNVWEQKAKDQVAVFIEKDGNIEAYARYNKKGFFDEGLLKVTDAFWLSIEGRIHLFRYFAKHIDQLARVQMCFPFYTKFQLWFRDNPDKFIVNVPPFPWMVRIIDVCEAVSDLPVSDKDTHSVIIEVIDEHCKWNSGMYRITSQKGTLHIEQTEDNPKIKIDIRGLTSLIYGVQPIDELLFNGWIETSDKNALRILKKWFSVIPFHNTFYY